MSQSEKRVLIVEDEFIIAEELSTCLKKLGYLVLGAVNNGGDALKIVMEDKPDLVLMDIRIKGDMDGFETAKHLYANYKIPVVFISAYYHDRSRIEDQFDFPYCYTLKPVDETRLKFAIENAFYIDQLIRKQNTLTNKLRESEERYRLAFMTSPDSININRLDGLYVDINDGFTRLTGYTRDDVIGKLSSEIGIWAIPADRERLVRELKENGVVENLESKFRRKDGSFTIALMSARLIKLNDLPHILSITRDISDRKEMEYQLQKAHDHLEQTVAERTQELLVSNGALAVEKNRAVMANEAKSEFVNIVSHELKSPLHHIISFSNFGLKKAGTVDNNIITGYFDTIYQSGNRLLSMVNELLDLSKIESGKMVFSMSETTLSSIIKSVLKEYKTIFERDDIRVELVDDEEPLALTCDYSKIGLVVNNLVSNAVKHSPRSGKIRIKICQPSEPHKKDDKIIPAVQLQIMDEGPGIPKNELELIFKKFYQSSHSSAQTSAKGTGLGLTLCQEVIKAHQGKIWAENGEVAGAIFNVVLPL